MKPEIIDIAPKYDTDKNQHGYIQYYAKHLPGNASKILEIGVHTGESIKMWHEVYPYAQIYGLDIFTNGIPFQADWVTWVKGSQVDGEILKELRNIGFDFIVEDGSHNSRDQLITFWGLVGCAPLYIAEDLHCCTEGFYRQGLNTYNTMLGLMVSELFPFQHDLYMDKIAFIYAP